MRRFATALLLLLVSLSLHAAITGTLVNSDGQPIAGARVSIYPLELPEAALVRVSSKTPDRTAIAQTTSDTKGRFSIPSPKDAVVAVAVSAAGFAPASLRAERDDELGAILMNAAAMTTGRITAAGKPVAGAKVILLGSGEYVATTDAEGKYAAPDPSRWANHIIVVHPDFAIISEGSRGPAMRAADLNQTLEPGVAVSGRVLGEDGKSPVAGAALVIDEMTVAKSAEDGSFTIAHAPKEWQTIDARSGNLAGTFARNGNAAAAIRVSRMATVSGTLRDMKSLAPVAGAMIQLRQGRRFAFGNEISAITDAKGAFVVNVPGGNYAINVLRPGYAVAQSSVNAPAAARMTKNLAGTQLARVSGVVVDENKNPVGGARVEAGSVEREPGMRMFRGNNGAQEVAIAAPDGSFVIRPEPDTDVQLEAKKKGYPEARSATMRFASGERKRGVVLTIPIGVAVTGRVVDRNGKPVADAAVYATEAQGGGSNFVRRIMRFGERNDDNVVKTAADGTFTTRVKPGTYNFRVVREGFATKAIASRQIGAGAPPIEITLDPGVALAGRITRGGAGLEGVTVDIFGEESAADSAKTGPDGSFRIEGLTPGQAMMNISKTEESVQQFRPVTIPSENLVIDLPVGASVSGRVVEKGSGNPVREFDAGYSAARGGGGMMFMGPGITKHFTSDDGSFVLEHVPPGAVNITVTAAGFTQGRAQNINVEDGKPVENVEVQLEHGTHVTGRVTSADGAPLSGVSVMVMAGGMRRFPGGPGTSASVTDANGEYSLENVESGEKTFTFERSGYLATQKSATISGSDARVDAQMNTGLRITGIVVTDSGVPQADASVTASSASDSAFGGRSTRTDANGQFEMADLTPGRYSFSASKAGYASGNVKDVDITSGAPVRITLQAGGTITGHITGLSAEEIPRAGVTAQAGNNRASGTIDSGGNYRIEGAPVGTARVIASVGGGMNARITPPQSVQVEPGGNVQVDLAFASGSVRGRLTRDGKGLAQAIVMFMPRPGQNGSMARTTADGDGNYEAQGLADATYDVQVIDITGGAPYRTSYEVHGGGTLNIDIKSALVRGRVIDATTGQAIDNAAVQIRSTDETFRGALRAVPSDASGTFIIDSVPSGKYTISAEKEGYGTRTTDLNVGDSGADVELKLAPTAGVTLRVVDARDGRPISAMIHVTDMANNVVYESPFRFTQGSTDAMKLPLDAGTYRVVVMAQGYATRNVTMSSPSTQTVGMTPGGTIAIKSTGSAMRRARMLGPDGREYIRGFGYISVFNVDPSPGTTIIESIAPGTYTLQILDGNNVTASTQVTVVEGQVAQVSI